MALVVALLGGGIKGAVAAAREAAKNELVLLHVSYGQPSALAEVEAARALAESFRQARLVAVDLPHIRQLGEQIAGHSQTPPASADAAETDDGTPSPNSLLGLMPVLASIGAQCAMRIGASRVTLGLCSKTDATHLGLRFPDGQPGHEHGFIHASNLMIETLSPQRDPVRIEAPLLDTSYAEAIQLAFHFQLPVDALWTCAASGPIPCERCQPCIDRASAFAEARRVDPLLKPNPAPSVDANSSVAEAPA